MSSFSIGSFMGDMAKSFAPELKDFVTDFMNKDPKMDNITWLGGTLVKHLPNMAPELVSQMGQGLIGAVGDFQSRLSSIQAAAAQGQATAEWLRDYLEDNIPQDKMQEYGDYLEQVQANMATGNQVVQQAMLEPDGMINITEEAFETPVATSGQEWNRFSMQPMIADLSQQAELMGMNGMAMPLGNEFMQQAMEMPTGVIPQELIDGSAQMSLDQGVKLATAAAIKVFIEKKKLTFLSKALPITGIADIACWGVEGAKCIGRLALGKISAAQAMEHMKHSTVAAMTGFITTGVAPKLLGMIPVVGMPLGIAASVLLASMSTETIQQKLSQGISLVAGVAQEMAQGVMATVTETAISVKNSVLRFVGLEA